MNQAAQMQREILLVHQDGVIAKVQLDQTAAGWSVHVLRVRRADGSDLHFGRAFAAGHNLDNAREQAAEEARRQIAEALGRQPITSGHTLHAVASPVQHTPGAYDAYIEAKDANGFTTCRMLVTLAGQHGLLTAAEAIELATASGFNQVVGVTADGQIQA